MDTRLRAIFLFCTRGNYCTGTTLHGIHRSCRQLVEGQSIDNLSVICAEFRFILTLSSILSVWPLPKTAPYACRITLHRIATLPPPLHARARARTHTHRASISSYGEQVTPDNVKELFGYVKPLTVTQPECAHVCRTRSFSCEGGALQHSQTVRGQPRRTTRGVNMFRSLAQHTHSTRARTHTSTLFLSFSLSLCLSFLFRSVSLCLCASVSPSLCPSVSPAMLIRGLRACTSHSAFSTLFCRDGVFSNALLMLTCALYGYRC